MQAKIWLKSDLQATVTDMSCLCGTKMYAYACGEMCNVLPAGIVESSSRRMGNRSKTLLKKGQCLGERAILEGEPAAESCTAGSPVMALIVNRYTCHLSGF